jgi:hypothetical protein
MKRIIAIKKYAETCTKKADNNGLHFLTNEFRSKIGYLFKRSIVLLTQTSRRHYTNIKTTIFSIYLSNIVPEAQLKFGY